MHAASHRVPPIPPRIITCGAIDLQSSYPCIYLTRVNTQTPLKISKFSSSESKLSNFLNFLSSNLRAINLYEAILMNIKGKQKKKLFSFYESQRKQNKQRRTKEMLSRSLLTFSHNTKKTESTDGGASDLHLNINVSLISIT